MSPSTKAKRRAKRNASYGARAEAQTAASVGPRWYQYKLVRRVAGTAAAAALTAALAFAWRYSVERGVESAMASWTFAAPLFEKLPKDIDVLVRDLKVDLVQGGSVAVLGPGPEDHFALTLSNVSKTADGAWVASVSLNGTMGSSVLAAVSHAFRVAPDSCSRELNAGEYEFVVCVEEIQMGSVAKLAVARRHAYPFLGAMRIERIRGDAIHMDGPRPAPIASRK